MDPSGSAPRNPDLAVALRLLEGRSGYARLYRNYYEGNHDLHFASAKFTSAFGELFRAFSYNLCAGVVDALADRCKLKGFGASTAAADAWDIWQYNRMTQQAGQVHADQFTAGDGYVIVWPDNTGKAEITVQRAEQMIVVYDPDRRNRIAWAAKQWVQADRSVRLTLYYPDQIEKYVTNPRSPGADAPTIRAFRALAVPGEAWPLPNPYGQVPVFHFPNNTGLGQWGRSELEDVKSLQDALNKSVADMMVAMEVHALPQRYATGLEQSRDEKGRPINRFTNEPGAVWAVGDTEVNFGQFAPSDLRQFLEVTAGFELKIARVSRIPLHWILPAGGNPPSGESLKTAEGPLLAKVADRLATLGPIWVDVLCFALRVEDQEIAPSDLQPDWHDPAPRSAMEQAQVAELHFKVGMPVRDILINDLGFTIQEADAMLTAHNAATAATDAAMIKQVAALQHAAQGDMAPPVAP